MEERKFLNKKNIKIKKKRLIKVLSQKRKRTKKGYNALIIFIIFLLVVIFIIYLLIIFYQKIFNKNEILLLSTLNQIEFPFDIINKTNINEVKNLKVKTIFLKNKYKNKDKEKQSFISKIINYFFKNNKKKEINICMSSDYNLIYPTLVSMTSALENNNENINILVYHLFLPNNITQEKLDIFESLKDKYNVKLNYYRIPSIFIKYRPWGGSTTVYWKLLIPFILPKIDRYLFLDGDTLVFNDLSDLCDLNFNDTYVFGMFFHSPGTFLRLKINIINYINSGVILLNNKKIIEDGKDIELLRATLEHSRKMSYPTQDPLNYVFNPKISIFPLKYGMYLIGNINVYNVYIKKVIKAKINETELEEAFNKPAIIHLCCCNPKIWHKRSRHDFKDNSVCVRFHNEFYFYANKTKYYNDIYNLYINKTK